MAANGTKRMTCWNCCEVGHSLSSCPQPQNSRLLEQRRKEFRANLKKLRDSKKTGAGNAAPKTPTAPPPKPSEDPAFAPSTEAERNRRMIKGKPMFWLSGRKRWVADRSPPTTTPAPTPTPHAPAGMVAIPNSGQSVLSSLAPTGIDRSALRQAALNSVAHNICVALQGFADVYPDA